MIDPTDPRMQEAIRDGREFVLNLIYKTIVTEIIPGLEKMDMRGVPLDVVIIDALAQAFAFQSEVFRLQEKPENKELYDQGIRELLKQQTQLARLRVAQHLLMRGDKGRGLKH